MTIYRCCVKLIDSEPFFFFFPRPILFPRFLDLILQLCLPLVIEKPIDLLYFPIKRYEFDESALIFVSMTRHLSYLSRFFSSPSLTIFFPHNPVTLSNSKFISLPRIVFVLSFFFGPMTFRSQT